MAKLKAHGYEVERVERNETRNNIMGEATQYRMIYSFRSDGHILRRVVVPNGHAASLYSESADIDYGWKLWKKFKLGKATPVENIRALALKFSK